MSPSRQEVLARCIALNCKMHDERAIAEEWGTDRRVINRYFEAWLSGSEEVPPKLQRLHQARAELLALFADNPWLGSDFAEQVTDNPDDAAESC
jgi:hypothetical protein